MSVMCDSLFQPPPDDMETPPPHSSLTGATPTAPPTVNPQAVAELK